MKSAEEIIKSLECCTPGNATCYEDCSYYPMTVGLTCMLRLKEDSLRLIREQDIKIQSLTRLLAIHGPGVFSAPEVRSNAPEPLKAHDAVNHPSHYTQGGVECIDALKAATTGLEGIEAVCTANAIKYLWRWKQKNGAEDLRKAVWYINRLLEETP